MCDHLASTLPISFPVILPAAPVNALAGQNAPCRLAQNAREDRAGQRMGECIIPGNAHIFIDPRPIRQQRDKAQRGSSSDLNRRHAFPLPASLLPTSVTRITPPGLQCEQGQEKGENRRYRQAEELQQREASAAPAPRKTFLRQPRHASASPSYMR